MNNLQNFIKTKIFITGHTGFKGAMVNIHFNRIWIKNNGILVEIIKNKNL